MSEPQPKVFVSSTIYDFRDLRSALKLWLEEYGYEVLMSEFNDFPQLPDKNSYESCLRAIEKSDYFVLLIGSRVGGWYDQAKQISITRMEYRHAYERFKQGNLKLLVFVRKEVWDIREDRLALKKFLEDETALDKELSPKDKTKLVGHPSKFLNDADFVIGFLQEVGRIAEMKQAVKGTAGFPGGNWVYQFASFRDIVDGCRRVLDLSGNLRQKALRTNLKHELKSILSELLEPTDDGVRPITRWSSFARKRFLDSLDDESSYKGNDLVWLGMFLLTSGNVGKRLKTTTLQEAITSGEFLDFDKATGTHTVGPLQQALLELEGQIKRLCNTPSDVFDVRTQLLKDERIKKNRQAMFPMPNHTLVMPFAVHDMIENVISLCRAIHLALEGDANELANVKLHPSSPIHDESEQIQREKVSLDDVRNWLNPER